jgi:hypothetical protein
MRLAILALFMCAGSVAICQSSPPARGEPSNPTPTRHFAPDGCNQAPAKLERNANNARSIRSRHLAALEQSAA